VTWAAEIVGPPGVGKSTVIEALTRHDVRTVDSLKAGAALIPSMLGVIAHSFRDRAARPRTLQEFRWMTRLTAAPSLVRGSRILFDQGPVYTIARLTGAAMRSSWLDEQTKRWSELLDLIVLLDAPDDVLIERIEGRAKTHALKGVADAQTRASLAKWRALYASVVSAMGDVALMRIDSATVAADQAAAQIMERA
jgi:shikimate kinase